MKLLQEGQKDQLKDSGCWLWQARSLFLAGRKVLSDSDWRAEHGLGTQEVYFFLMASGIGALLKARLVERGLAPWRKQRLSGKFKSANLLRLAERARFAVEPWEKPVLQALSVYLRWRGRHPATPPPGPTPDQVEALIDRLCPGIARFEPNQRLEVM